MSAEAIAMRPVADGERTELIDVLRGFALLGILLVNFWGGTGTVIPRVDEAVSNVLQYAVSGSFYPLFSFLFGLGFGIQLLRARERGGAAALLYLRRMLVLFLIGTVHAVFIWNGDILVDYAALGLVLVPLGRLPDRGLLLLIVVLAGVQIASERVRTAVDEVRGQDATVRELVNAARGEATAVENNLRRRADDGEASWSTAVFTRWMQYSRRMEYRPSWQNFVFSDILLLFLIGMYVGRKRILERPEAHRRGLLLAAAIALVALTLAHVYRAYDPKWPAEFGMLAWWGQDKGVTILYVVIIALLFSHFARAAAALRIFAAPGRMGLTNYLMQSLVMTLLFVSYGAGLTPLKTTAQLVFSLAFFFLFQVPVSRWWMARFRYGPAEWLWRLLTYGTPQPMLRRPETTVSQPEPVAALM
jgi:uncharacterized protein